MKKILLVLLGLVILAVSFSGCGGGGENKKDDGMVDLWVLVAEYYDVPEDKQDQLGERACLYAYEYDKNGNLIEKKEFPVGNPERYTVTTYQYNEHGDCISVKIDPTRQYPDMDVQPMVIEYEYEYDGELITKKTTVGGRVETYEYEGGRLQKIASGDGASVSKGHRKFDENGNMVEWCQRYSENGTDEVDRFVYSYDNKGRLIKIE